MRGEQIATLEEALNMLGSPPLARGTEGWFFDSQVLRRITPACAGNRDIIETHRVDAEDHPRLRGEQIKPRAQGAGREGSPPLARGTVLRSARLPPCGRITPACAGNSIPMKRICVQVGDHPRLRGEQSDS